VRLEVAFGKTPLGQLLYDLAFTTLNLRYLARKHRMPIAQVRILRATALNALKPPRRKRRRRREGK
jgi:hypothetical protein